MIQREGFSSTMKIFLVNDHQSSNHWIFRFSQWIQSYCIFLMVDAELLVIFIVINISGTTWIRLLVRKRVAVKCWKLLNERTDRVCISKRFLIYRNWLGLGFCTYSQKSRPWTLPNGSTRDWRDRRCIRRWATAGWRKRSNLAVGGCLFFRKTRAKELGDVWWDYL